MDEKDTGSGFIVEYSKPGGSVGDKKIMLVVRSPTDRASWASGIKRDREEFPGGVCGIRNDGYATCIVDLADGSLRVAGRVSVSEAKDFMTQLQKAV